MATVVWSTQDKIQRVASSLSSNEQNSDDKIKDGPVVMVEPLGEPVAARTRIWQKSQIVDLDAIATQRSVYDDPETAKLYQPRDDWENKHRFDPSARWTWREEKKLLRKIDWKILVFACVAFMSLEIDRINIQQALTDDFLKDLHITSDDYNLGNTVFKAAFLCSELPSQLVSKWVGPDRWIPTQMILWSVVAASQYSLTNRTGFLTCRALLGILQGGFIPDMILYLSYFYTSRELPLKLSIWWTSAFSADIIASFMAFGLLHMRGISGKSGWRWLFLIEGLVSGTLGILAYFMMPASPTQTKGILRGKNGWFTEREETIIVTRALRDDPSKGTMHNRQPVTPKLLWKSLCDYHLWPLYAIALTFSMPMTPPAQYLTLSLKGLGFSTFQTNLLVIPSTALHIIGMLGITWLSDRTGHLALIAMLAQLWALPELAALYSLNSQKEPKWSIWAIVTLLVGYPFPHAIQVGWCSRNSNHVRLRTVSAAMYNMFSQAEGMIASNIYRSDDAPQYKRGNMQLLAVNCANVFLYIAVFLYYRTVNKRRDNIWNSWTPEQREDYVKNTKDEGNKRLDFRFEY
ncbi:hypothetical protein B7463_g216, partial [Scytalidium lignicola]